MPGRRFHRYQLRTTDMNAARAFYTDVFGSEFWDSHVILTPLPERAAALGAPAHWLGHIGPCDIEETTKRFLASGGQQLGPVQRGAGGSLHAILRDPFGSVAAVSQETATSPRGLVAWHLLHSADHERAFAFYGPLFGWTATELLELGAELGAHQLFSWEESGQSVGGVANTARLPGVHPHWLFHFRVAHIEEALARVGARGGKTFQQKQTPSGNLTALCEDAQGAAFALFQ